jgi:predicted anti-sigma-YlaC factor YlaD
MNDCPNAEIRDQLPDLLHERLDPAARAVVEAHLAACPDCRAELALLRSLRDAAFVPPVDVSRIVAALPAPRAARGRTWGGGWRIAAAITIMVIGGSSLASIINHRASLGGGDSTASAAQGPELLVSEEYGELSAAQLRSLLKNIPKLDALPLTDPEVPVPVSILPGNGGAE